MRVSGHDFGGDETNLTAEVICFEARSEEKDDGIEKRWTSAMGYAGGEDQTERTEWRGRRGSGKGGPPLSRSNIDLL